MCRFENGWVSPWATRWLHKISLLLMFVDSRARTEHWIKKDWPLRSELIPGSLNLLAPPLVERFKIVFSPLHIKLGIMKQFVKALEKDSDCFKYICMKFSSLTIEKLKAGIFDGPQIRKLMNDANFCNFMNFAELSAWTAFANVVKFFLGKTKAPNYKELVETLHKSPSSGCKYDHQVTFFPQPFYNLPKRFLRRNKTLITLRQKTIIAIT